MSHTTLLSLTKDEAVVAENVTTYRRAEIVEQAKLLNQQLSADKQRLPQLEQEIQQIKQRISATSYTLDLYSALLEEFDKHYPLIAAEHSEVADIASQQVMDEAEEVATVDVADKVGIDEVPVAEEEQQ